jgi:AraC-like DNA-binding protein
LYFWENVVETEMNIVFGHIDQFDYVMGENVRHKFPMHIHQTFCIGMVTRGQRSIRFPHGEETIGEGDIFVINAGQPHAVSASEYHSYIAISTAQIPVSYSCSNKIQSSRCRELFENLQDAIADGEQSRIQSLMTGMLNALDEFQVTIPGNQKPVVMIQKALEFISRHYHEPVSINDIAGHVYVSPFHFCHLFKQHTGISPYNYLLQYRINRSRPLLKNHCPVFDAAIASGFYDSSHYIRHFVSYEGISPGHYQKYFS